MTETIKYDIVILGSGPAGNTAGIYLSRGGVDVAMVHGGKPGGQLTTTTEIENFPGFPEPMQGPELMERMIQQSKNVGVKEYHDIITKVDFSKRPYVLEGESGDKYECKQVIISTGTKTRWLGLESEKKFMGFGVSACAICDGMFYKGTPVAIIGGGNTAVEEAIYMSNIAEKVYLIHRRDSLRAEQVLQDQLFKNEKIEMIWDSEVLEVLGQDMPKGVTGLKLRNKKTDEEHEVEVEGIFVAIGATPSTAIFKDSGLELNEAGYIRTKDNSTETNLKGIYAAGDVRELSKKQAIIAAGEGCLASLEAQALWELEK